MAATLDFHASLIDGTLGPPRARLPASLRSHLRTRPECTVHDAVRHGARKEA